MKFAKGNVRSGSPRRVSMLTLLLSFVATFLRFHLSLAYPGQTKRKCFTVSLVAPHAGQLALSALLNLLRCELSGT